MTGSFACAHSCVVPTICNTSGYSACFSGSCALDCRKSRLSWLSEENPFILVKTSKKGFVDLMSCPSVFPALSQISVSLRFSLSRGLLLCRPCFHTVSYFLATLLCSLLSGVWMVWLRRMSVASWPDLFVQSK